MSIIKLKKILAVTLALVTVFASLALLSSCGSTKNDIKALRDDLTKLQNEVNTQKSKVGDLESANQALTAKITAIEAKITALETFQATLSTAVADIAGLRTSVTGLTELTGTLATKAEVAAQVAVVANALSGLQETVAGLTARADAVPAAIASAVDVIDAKVAALTKALDDYIELAADRFVLAEADIKELQTFKGRVDTLMNDLHTEVPTLKYKVAAIEEVLVELLAKSADEAKSTQLLSAFAENGRDADAIVNLGNGGIRLLPIKGTSTVKYGPALYFHEAKNAVTFDAAANLANGQYVTFIVSTNDTNGAYIGECRLGIANIGGTLYANLMDGIDYSNDVANIAKISSNGRGSAKEITGFDTITFTFSESYTKCVVTVGGETFTNQTSDLPAGGVSVRAFWLCVSNVSGVDLTSIEIK